MTGTRIESAARRGLGLAIVVALALGAGVALAQQGPGRHGPDADAQLARLTTKLQLTADQQQKIRPILVERDQQVVALRSQVRSGAIDRDAAASQIREIRQDSTQKIEAVLTPAQRREYEQLMAEMAQRWKSHRGMRGSGGGMGPGTGAGAGPGEGGARPAP